MRQQSDLRKKIEDYSYGLSQILSENTYSKIYKGMKENNKEAVAIKVIDIKSFKSKQDKKPLEIEIQVLRKADHPNILRCLDVYSTYNNCYIITEYCATGNLKTQMENKKMKFTEAEAITIFRDIYQGYRYLYLKGYVHRNIDLSNILIKNGQYKLADFGLASKELDTPIKTEQPLALSPYRSPESLLSEMVGPKCDIWALGILLYHLLHDKVPFANYDYRFSFTTPIQFGNISQKAKQLIQKCLLPDSLRITFPEMEAHPFITQMASKSLANRAFLRQDYRSVPMTKVVSNMQNKPNASQIDRLMNIKKNKAENAVKSQTCFVKYLYKIQQLLPQSKLQFLVIKQLLSILDSLKRSVSLENSFECQYIQAFFSTQKSASYVQEIQQYSKKCHKLQEVLQKYIIKGTKNKKFIQCLDSNLKRNQGFIIQTLPWIIQFVKSTLEQLKGNRQFQKLDEEEVLPKGLQTVALSIDYCLTYYQLNCIGVTNFNDLIQFYQVSKIDQITKFQPASLQKKHIKDIQKKISQLGI